MLWERCSSQFVSYWSTKDTMGREKLLQEGVSFVLTNAASPAVINFFKAGRRFILRSQ